MAEDEAAGDKTEAPSGRRVTQSRQQGMVGQSAELSQVLGLIAAYMALLHIAPSLWNDLITLFKYLLSPEIISDPLTLKNLKKNLFLILYHLGPKLFTIMVIAAFFGAGCSALQTNFLWSWQLVKPKLSKLNPLAGLRRIFSLNNSVNLIKQICKLAIIFPIAYYTFFDLLPQFNRIPDLATSTILTVTADMATLVFKKIISLLFLLALADFFWQRYSVRKKMMMSKVEVKEERKAMEGDETIRKKIIAIGLQRARERMMKNVPKADVVVTNPTHIAVALVYSGEMGSAPQVVAKGQGHIAERIKEVARRHGVPIVERKPLARALFKVVEVGGEIPQDLFRAVAEILAYVYRLKGKNPIKSRKNK